MASAHFDFSVFENNLRLQLGARLGFGGEPENAVWLFRLLAGLYQIEEFHTVPHF